MLKKHCDPSEFITQNELWKWTGSYDFVLYIQKWLDQNNTTYALTTRLRLQPFPRRTVARCVVAISYGWRIMCASAIGLGIHVRVASYELHSVSNHRQFHSNVCSNVCWGWHLIKQATFFLFCKIIASTKPNSLSVRSVWANLGDFYCNSFPERFLLSEEYTVCKMPRTLFGPRCV